MSPVDGAVIADGCEQHTLLGCEFSSQVRDQLLGLPVDQGNAAAHRSHRLIFGSVPHRCKQFPVSQIHNKGISPPPAMAFFRLPGWQIRAQVYRFLCQCFPRTLRKRTEVRWALEIEVAGVPILLLPGFHTQSQAQGAEVKAHIPVNSLNPGIQHSPLPLMIILTLLCLKVGHSKTGWCQTRIPDWLKLLSEMVRMRAHVVWCTSPPVSPCQTERRLS